MKYGYARVSADDQKADMQRAALKKAGCKKIFTDDGLSGDTVKRPALLRCLKALKRGDTLIVWKLDRLSRSVRDFVIMADDLKDRGIKFPSLTEQSIPPRRQAARCAQIAMIWRRWNEPYQGAHPRRPESRAGAGREIRTHAEPHPAPDHTRPEADSCRRASGGCSRQLPRRAFDDLSGACRDGLNLKKARPLKRTPAEFPRLRRAVRLPPGATSCAKVSAGASPSYHTYRDLGLSIPRLW